MRFLGVGLVLGLLLGTAAQAGAQYLHGAIWYRLNPQAQTSYVAGVADALESLTAMADRVGPDRVIERARQASRCAGQVPPSRLAALGDNAIRRAPHYAPPSTAIIFELVTCGVRPYGWGQEGQPYYYRPPSDDGRNDHDQGR